MLGNMYSRLRGNRTSFLLIPPLIRLAYQFGGPLLERMGSALGWGAQATGGGGTGIDPFESLIQAAIQGALSAPAAGGGGGAGQLASALGGLANPGGLGAFGPALAAGPIGGFGGGVRPGFFRRRR